ncbi:response regulator [Sphingomonas changnyeongensis]|uniref:Response regulator n=1 Tax=Sphingomonas changnyeongensis TaxID=2698679 RepID=A0A7Z2NYT7_9SPHN|nr:response regulator [Sphingomonas changnyeongensis]
MSSGAAILLIDDNPEIARAVAIAFRIAGDAVDWANGPDEAWSAIARRRYDAILLDMNFTAGAADGEEGLACLRRIIAADPQACVVVITAHSGIRIAVAAMQAGARDFVMKPWRNADLIDKVRAAIAGQTLRPAAMSSPSVQPISGAEPPPTLIGESAVMAEVRALIGRVGPTRASVTVTGPPGSGRTLAARAIHAASADAASAIMRVDVRDPDQLAALAGAGGTVLLRHPDALDPVAQDSLADRLPPELRCLTVAETVDRLTPALRRRLATVELAMPPLSRRGDDVLRLARHFARMAADRFGRPQPVFTPAAEAGLRAAFWPDEVRGLALAVERAVVLAEDGRIDMAMLDPAGPAVADSATPEPRFDLTDAEQTMIRAALREHRHNVSRAAAALGLSRGALYRRMARYGL